MVLLIDAPSALLLEKASFLSKLRVETSWKGAKDDEFDRSLDFGKQSTIASCSLCHRYDVEKLNSIDSQGRSCNIAVHTREFSVYNAHIALRGTSVPSIPRHSTTVYPAARPLSVHKVKRLPSRFDRWSSSFCVRLAHEVTAGGTLSCQRHRLGPDFDLNFVKNPVDTPHQDLIQHSLWKRSHVFEESK